MTKRAGKRTVCLSGIVSAAGFAAVGARAEGLGPLGSEFDMISDDSYFGEDSWEKAESRMQQLALTMALRKSGASQQELHYLLAGDLLNQCIASTFGLMSFCTPFLGLFGACSSSALGMGLAAMLVDGGYASKTAAVTSSHFSTAERQFRTPLAYGAQRPPTAQRTATAAGAVVITSEAKPPFIRRVTTGEIKDLGVTDANNMGAAMAPAAADTISAYFSDTGARPSDFDMIVTGDLGAVGSELLLELCSRQGLDISSEHRDCGLMLYDRKKQDVDSGGSGCGCSASVLCAALLPKLRDGQLKRILFAATGALMSPTSSQQGQPIPGIAHLVELSHTGGD